MKNATKTPEYFTSVQNAQFNRPASKLHTVNVIELIMFDLISIQSFPDNAQGNKRAENLFKRVARSYGKHRGDTITMDELTECLDNGVYECAGYKLLLTHSI